MQRARGFIDGCANGWLWSPGRQSTPNSKLGKLFICKKKHTISILHMGYKVIGYMFAKQSHWYKLRGLLFKLKAILLVQTGTGFCSNLGARRLFSSLAGFLLGVYWLAGSRSPDGGGESHHFMETETQVPAACQPQPQQLHIIKLISQLQKPTRKISDTWIIDTGKRETRYRIVKIHQTIRQPHIPSFFFVISFNLKT